MDYSTIATELGVEAALGGLPIFAGSKKVASFINKSLKSNKNLKKFSPQDYLERRQHLKLLIEQGLVDPKVDINTYARSLEKTEDLTRRAIDYQNTFYRGVTPKIPTSRYDFTESIDTKNIMEEMKRGGVDLTSEESIGKYMASHVPLESFGYRAGLTSAKGYSNDALYTSLGRSSYGDMTFRLKKPTDFSKGSYKDWINNHNQSSQPTITGIIKDELDGRSINTEVLPPFTRAYEYSKDKFGNRRYSSIFVGKKGQKVFDDVERVTEYGREKTTPLPYKHGGPVRKYKNGGQVGFEQCYQHKIR